MIAYDETVGRIRAARCSKQKRINADDCKWVSDRSEGLDYSRRAEANHLNQRLAGGAEELLPMIAYLVEVDRKKCIACGTCYSSRSLFEPDEGGYARVMGGKTDELRSFRVFNNENMDSAASTAGYCPVSAITVSKGNGTKASR
jgi:ferredoxin